MLNMIPESFGFLMNSTNFFFLSDTKLTELWYEKFEWFGPSPIEPDSTQAEARQADAVLAGTADDSQRHVVWHAIVHGLANGVREHAERQHCRAFYREDLASR